MLIVTKISINVLIHYIIFKNVKKSEVIMFIMIISNDL